MKTQFKLGSAMEEVVSTLLRRLGPYQMDVNGGRITVAWNVGCTDNPKSLAVTMQTTGHLRITFNGDCSIISRAMRGLECLRRFRQLARDHMETGLCTDDDRAVLQRLL